MAWSGAVGQSNGGRLEGFQSALSVLMRRRFSTGMDPGPKRRLALFHMRQRSCDSTWSSVYPEETLSAIYEKRKSATLPLRPAKVSPNPSIVFSFSLTRNRYKNSGRIPVEEEHM